MDLAIDPEPSAEERAAIVAALGRTAFLDADAPSEWARAEVEDEPNDWTLTAP